MDKITFISRGPKDTKLFAQTIAKKLKPNDIVGFIGDLATGKTTLIGEIVKALKGEKTQSPTFTYLNTYAAIHIIYHFDLYRIKDNDHFLSLGFDEFFMKGGICLIEWANTINLPENAYYMRLFHEGNRKRKFIYETD